MICAEESASTDRQRLLDPTRPMREPVRYRTAAGVARAVLGRARNRQTPSRALGVSVRKWVSVQATFLGAFLAFLRPDLAGPCFVAFLEKRRVFRLVALPWRRGGSASGGTGAPGFGP